MKNMWSDDRSIMLEQNVEALLICKTNIDLTCSEFYEKIESNTDFRNWGLAQKNFIDLLINVIRSFCFSQFNGITGTITGDFQKPKYLILLHVWYRPT